MIQYDPSLVNNNHGATDNLSGSTGEPDPFDVPIPPSIPFDGSTTSSTTGPFLAYLKQPDVVNNTLVVVSEGDMYYARNNKVAMKLTTTVGNVMSPKIYPGRPEWIAYTATYTGSRDVYVMNLRTRLVRRLTYGLDAYLGVQRVVAWKNDGTLIVAAWSTTSRHLPGTVLYELDLDWGGDDHDDGGGHLPTVAQYRPLPLAQAIDGTYHGDCLYFVRYNQGSHTMRYVGGTVEQIWRYCEDEDEEAALVTKLQGTSKAPGVATYNGAPYLLYLSDRDPASAGAPSAVANVTSMNLWAMPLSAKRKNNDDDDSQAIILTRASCQFNGLTIREYAVDPVTNHVVLRIGADLYQLKASDVAATLRDAGRIVKPKPMGIRVYSDFASLQERLIPLSDSTSQRVDVMTLASGTSTLLTIRGQAWMAPVLDSTEASAAPYSGGGQNLPRRRYRLVPSSTMGGSVRVLAARQVPLLLTPDDPRRLALMLATDPVSQTAEHAFYLVEVQEAAAVVDLQHPVLGGHLNGGPTASGGLGSVLPYSVSVSPCGRRVAWADTDGRICVWTLPTYTNQTRPYQVLPKENELGEPMDGATSSLSWSPGGRYLGVSHAARNQFNVITLVDCGDATPPNTTATKLEIPDIQIGRAVQVTSSRFNSDSPVWGKSSLDFYIGAMAKLLGIDLPAATTLYFLTDRDVQTDVPGPWGSRAPQPHFPRQALIYALPLSPSDGSGEDWKLGRFVGGAAQEIFTAQPSDLTQQLSQLQATKDPTTGRRLRQVVSDVQDDVRRGRLHRRHATTVVRWLKEIVRSTDRFSASNYTTLNGSSESLNETSTINPGFTLDLEIDFGPPKDLTFAHRAYRVANIPRGKYFAIVSQLSDDPTLVVAEADDSFGNWAVKLMVAGDFPSDAITPTPVGITGLSLIDFGLSTSREHFYLRFAPGSKVRVVGNTVASVSSFLSDSKGNFDSSFADTSLLAMSVIPRLEYRQMYYDAWRMLRDYFYDPNLHGVDWLSVHGRYLPLVDRCAKREDLDDVLEQMASELSALHVFVYGGEYDTPFHGLPELTRAHAPASLGVSLERAPEWKGYRITEIPQRDPDYNIVNNFGVYCPLSDATLKMSGQKGLQVGDVIVAVNGESVIRSDISALLRGLEGRSVRLDVLRLTSGMNSTRPDTLNANASTEPIIATAISPTQAMDLRYYAWEYKTQRLAQKLALEAGFTVAYIHLRSMLYMDVNDFARSFYPDYDKQALILDVRHNGGGNIDSWILTALQRKVWSYWRNRRGPRVGDIDWDEQFAFQGHVVVLVDEKTGSDGEGVARGISELGLGRLIGTRTWGGGIWLSSDNVLVDGGIATAPEIGTYNRKFGYGMGIENVGIEPDVVVDNNPRTAFDGKDTQLERAIEELKQWLQTEPVVIPTPPAFIKDVSLHEIDCPA
jgi:C-terminal processing protease CtpA/Prc